jgi:putative membrane protein
MPAMLITWALGLTLAVHLGAFDEPWLMAKLALVLVLSGYQGWIMSYGRKLSAGRRELEDKKLRMMNEVPGILTALIVVLVIVRPF